MWLNNIQIRILKVIKSILKGQQGIFLFFFAFGWSLYSLGAITIQQSKKGVGLQRKIIKIE